MSKSGLTRLSLLLAATFSMCILPTIAGDGKIAGKQTIAQSTPVDGGIQTLNSMIVTTTDVVDGYRIREYRGIVRGVMVREPNVVQSFKAGFQGMFGGKIEAYIKNCEMGRQAAIDAMVQQAQARGANAVVAVRYDSDSIQGTNNAFGTEIVCYGTAVVVEPKAPQN